MECTFSEFSYGYALTRDFASGRFGSLTAAPVFPSQYQEGQLGGGYDIHIPLGAPLFIQFKLSHYLYRSNASEWSIFQEPYYRMYLRPLRHSDQHRLLTDLENTGKTVYYAAPIFNTVKELNEAYAVQAVLDRSIFFSPAGLGYPPDNDLHYVAFNRLGTWGGMCSKEPRLITKFYMGKELAERELLRVIVMSSKIDEEFFGRIADDLVDILDKRAKETGRLKEFQIQLNQQKEKLREKASFAAYLTRVFFDAEMFVVGEGINIQ